MRLKSYRDLEVWQRAADLAVIADRLGDRLIGARRYAMANQLLSASISVTCNIAEGNGRAHVGEYAHHVSMARGSLLEVESILLVAVRAGRLSQAECEPAFALITAVGRMLTNLLRALRRKWREMNGD